VSVSGRVDQRTHRLLFSPNAPWGQIDLYAELQRVLETPIEMENAANACLFAERWFGNFGDASNMIAISVSEGIGAGCWWMDAWCEAGTTWRASSATCRLRKPVLFAAAATWVAGRPLRRTAPGCGITSELAPESTLESVQELLELALKGDIRALRSIDKMMTYLARGLPCCRPGWRRR
jgi:predicted NBD/HSP70 family sugar kinase